MGYYLVYQNCIANVFRQQSPDAPYVRVLQSSYGNCEYFCLGLREVGARVCVCHCDQLGDVGKLDWADGEGSLWFERKRPPITTWTRATLHQQ
jgi:hypothetical protein